jgi:hypothetical protein
LIYEQTSDQDIHFDRIAHSLHKVIEMIISFRFF